MSLLVLPGKERYIWNWGSEQRTNLMDKEDTGTSLDANTNHSPDSSIHTCKEERVREKLLLRKAALGSKT